MARKLDYRWNLRQVMAGRGMFQTTDLPAAVLARMLGIHITVAVAWQRASAGDWAAYAAEVSRRDHPSPDARTPAARPR